MKKIIKDILFGFVFGALIMASLLLANACGQTLNTQSQEPIVTTATATKENKLSNEGN